MVLITKRKVNNAVKKLVTAKILPIRGDTGYERLEANILKIKIIKTTVEGIKIPQLSANLFSPHGSWLNIGRRGGNFE